jgi:predicted nucleic acid-binding protein
MSRYCGEKSLKKLESEFGVNASHKERVQRFLPDTSCMIAAVCGWHENHESALAAISARRERGDQLIVASHALLEMYAVLTRLPAPHRLSSKDAAILIRSNFIDGATAVSLTAADYRKLIIDAPMRGFAGGRAYDALIVECARKAKVSSILTFNSRDFANLVPKNIEAVIPS